MKTPSSFAQKDIIRSLSTAALCGIVAGIVASILDTRQAAVDLDGAGEMALLALQTTGRATLAGIAMALFASLITWMGNSAWRKIGRDPTSDNGAATALALTASPGLIYISVRLFQGGVTSQLPARTALIAATAVILVALTWVVARICLKLFDRVDRRPRPVVIPVIVVATIVAGSLGARWFDAHMYRRLYLYLHVLLAVVTLGGLAVAARIIISNRPGRPAVIRAGAVGTAIVAILAALAGIFSEQAQTVKVAIYDRTATTANILLLTTGPRKIGQGPRPSEETRRLRYERDRQARLASARGDFPVFPGAHLMLITVDALRADKLGLYGYRERDLSPRLDEWSTGATIFNRAYCTAPHSSYSISSFLTSHYIHDEAKLGRDISHPTIAEILGESGYETSGLYTNGIFFTEGENVSHYKKIKFGFDSASHGAPPPEKLTDNTIAEIDRMVARGEPAFFIWSHYFNVHEPYVSTRFGTSPRDRYEGEIVNADREISRLLAYMDEHLARDVIVVITADHGEEFKEHGGHYHGSTLYEEQVRVPLIIKVPGAAPTRISSPVSLADMAPTVLKLLGVEPPPSMAGRDLRPAIFGGQKAHVPTPVFSSVMHRHMALRWPWKLVSDPSRGLFELYNLEDDPGEKVNRYDENKTLSDELLQETYAWLDEIGTGADEAQTALNLGRMRDKRAVPGLMEVAANRGAPSADRVEALVLLSKIKAWRHEKALVELLGDDDDQVATHAALALAAVDDDSGVSVLQDALYDEDPAVRDGTALALAKLGDKSSVPILIEALGRDDLKVRENAIRLLGDLADSRATEPLIETIAEDRTRYLSVLALGKIGDKRAYETLMDVLKYETHTDIRGYAVVSLGWMRATESLPRLIKIFHEEPELKWTSEALIRLGAINEGLIHGADLNEQSPAKKKGWGRCHKKDWVIAGEFMGRTTCETTGSSATVTFNASTSNNSMLVIRARHLLEDKGATPRLTIEIGGREIGHADLGGELEEYRIDLPGGGSLADGANTIRLKVEPECSFEVDHLFVIDKK